MKRYYKPLPLMRNILLALGLSAALYATSCKKAVVAEPPIGSLLSNNIFKGDATAMAAMSSVYVRVMSNTGSFVGGSKSISLLMGMAADEIQNYKQSAPYTGFYANNIATEDNFWSELFAMLYTCNAVLEGIDGPEAALTEAMKQELRGEAKFMRAFLLFYGTNLYGEFPIITRTDYRVNNEARRSAPADVYKQIVTDLQDAQHLLPEDYINTGLQKITERTRPNKAAATALLARVYLYLKDWKNAATQATTLINNNTYVLDTTLANVFSKDSKEAIWQLQPVVPGYNSNDATYFILVLDPGISSPGALQESLVNSFDSTDKRRAIWVGTYTSRTGLIYHFPNKYQTNLSAAVAEYQMVFRLAEQYLIRAEARAQQQDLVGAAQDVNTIRTRAGLPNIVPTTQTAMLDSIINERRLELFTEWGHRWFDLKRANRLDGVMTTVTAQKGGAWKATSQLLPLPLNELFLNPNLTQNTGY